MNVKKYDIGPVYTRVKMIDIDPFYTRITKVDIGQVYLESKRQTPVLFIRETKSTT